MLGRFRRIGLLDWEWVPVPGELPERILCVSYFELHSGRWFNAWLDGTDASAALPKFGPEDLLVAFAAQAELTVLQQLGLELPGHILDLRVEYLGLKNGFPGAGSGLISALKFYELVGGTNEDAAHKRRMHDLCKRGGIYTREEKLALVAYCRQDVEALRLLLPAILKSPGFNLDEALERGRDVLVNADVENAGIPVDTDAWALMKQDWNFLRLKIASRAEILFPGIFRGTSFRYAAFARYLRDRRIWAPKTRTGKLRSRKDTLSELAELYPEFEILKDARAFVRMASPPLEIGKDGRARAQTWAFGTKTGRCSPSSSTFIMSMPAMMRSLVTAPPGLALAYVDLSGAEYGFAAGISGDVEMMRAYASGDPYLHFATLVGAAPEGATKATHGEIREKFKTTSLGLLYGMQAFALSRRLGIQLPYAEELIAKHREMFPTFWAWSDSVFEEFQVDLTIATGSGWTLRAGFPTADRQRLAKLTRTVTNFPIQAGIGDVQRIALRMAKDEGVKVVAGVHDAALIEAGPDEIRSAAATMQECYRLASIVVMQQPGFYLKSDATIVESGGRFRDKRGQDMWRFICETVGIEP
jgi:DNA polymerase I